MISTFVRLEFNKLPGLTDGMDGRAAQVVRKIAFDVKAGAEERTVRVDTGAMKAGYVVEMEDPLTAVIYNTQEYHIYQELGTRFISASPMLGPAAEEQRGPFLAAMAQIVSGL